MQRFFYTFGFSCFIFLGQSACTPKQLSLSDYGEQKSYRDEDSTGGAPVREKKTKMPFDTSSVRPGK